MDGGTKVETEFEVEPNEDESPDEITRSHLERISLSAADWTTETLLSQLERGNITLSPQFQRRDAWRRDKKSRFIESLILNFPVPQIVLAEQRDARARFIVLDGKQRLTALLKFAGQANPDEPLNGFSLTGLDVRKDLIGRTYEDLVNDPSLSNEVDSFLNQTIRTVVIRNWNSEAVLHTIFVRLNTSSVPLSPQELRQALFPGPFVSFIDERAFRSDVLKEFMGLQHADFRMRDVEILLRYLAFAFHMELYSGNMSRFLNETAQKLNQDFPSQRGVVEQAVDDFESALEASIDIFGLNHVARKWTETGFERPSNRAILDVLLFYFSDKEVREQAIRKKDRVVAAYKYMFETNSKFRDSVAATTKSLNATYDRFVIWGNILEKELDISLQIPHWNDKGNRLVLPSSAV